MMVAQAEALYRSGDDLTALQVVELALHAVGLSKADQARAYFIGGMCECRLGRHVEAVRSLSAARGLAIEAMPEKLGEVMLELGIAQCTVGDLPVGAATLEESLSYPLTHAAQARVLFELGSIGENNRTGQDAFALYLQARDFFRLAGDRGGEFTCLLHAAWFHLQVERPMAALPFLHEAQDLAPDRLDQMAPHLALYCYQIGDTAGAAAIWEDAFSYLAGQPENEVDHWFAGELAWIGSVLSLDVKDFAAARKFAQYAIQQGLHLRWSDLTNRANKVRVQAERALETTVEVH